MKLNILKYIGYLLLYFLAKYELHYKPEVPVNVLIILGICLISYERSNK